MKRYWSEKLHDNSKDADFWVYKNASSEIYGQIIYTGRKYFTFILRYPYNKVLNQGDTYKDLIKAKKWIEDYLCNIP